MTDIMPGDKVMCLVGYYKSYEYGQIATVLALDVSGAGNPVIILKNPHCEYGTSMYSIDNWKFHSRPKPKEKPTMAPFEKTKFFGVRLSKEQTLKEFLYLDEDQMTELVDSKSAAIKDVQESITEGEEWVVLQIIAKIAPAEPKPPIVVTEYR